MDIHRFIQDVSFDDVAMRVMGAAFDQACDALGSFGVTEREIVAKRIIEVAKMGERDQSRLYRHAVDGFGIGKKLPNTVHSDSAISPDSQLMFERKLDLCVASRRTLLMRRHVYI